jgi:hypothetical protein
MASLPHHQAADTSAPSNRTRSKSGTTIASIATATATATASIANATASITTATATAPTTSTSTSSTTWTWTLAVFSALDQKAFERQVVADATTSIVAQPECKIRCTDQDTLTSLVDLLCHEVVRDRREDRTDCKIHQHLWSFKILRPGEKSFESRSRSRSTRANKTNCAAEDEASCDVCDDRRPRMEITSDSPSVHYDDLFLPEDEPDAVQVSPDTALGDLKAWGLSSQLYLEYDMGNTTNVFLRVVAREATQEGDKLGLIMDEDDADQVAVALALSQDQGDLEQIPAFSLPIEKQMDTAYPSFCQALLGKTEPIRFFTMGLSSIIRRPNDTAFASIRGGTSGNDVLFCPIPFDNMDEFMVLSEMAWGQSPEHAKRYRVGHVMYHIFPPNEQGKTAHQTCLREDEENPMAAYGPKVVYLYKDKIAIESDFRFSETFPQTAEQLASGRSAASCRWTKRAGPRPYKDCRAKAGFANLAQTICVGPRITLCRGG